MASPASDARLEEFVERATSAAAARAGRRLDWAPKDREGFWSFHCPLEGPAHDPHRWSGAPRARAKLVGGRIRAGCSKCTEGKFDDAYAQRVLEAIGADNITEVEFGAAHSRNHHYLTCDDRFEVRRTKVTFKDRRKTPLWLWKIRDRNGGFFASYQSFEPSEFCAEHYPELKSFYLALRLYGFDRFKPSATYRVVITEGERDADTWNALTAEAGEAGLASWIATTLPIPTPKALSLHQRVILAARDVVLIGDADEGGARFIAAWHKAIGDVAASVRILPPEALDVTTPGKDLSDHVEQQENAGRSKAAIARRLFEKISSLPVAEAPPLRGWRDDLLQTQKGAIKTDSLGNADIVLRRHPDLMGKIRRDIRLSEAEIVAGPWGAPVRGARAVASTICAWLEQAEKLSLAPRALEAVLNFDRVAPPYNPFDYLASQAWDGVGRVDSLFTHTIPLDVDPFTGRQLARVFMEDFAAKLHGDLRAQRILLAIITEKAEDAEAPPDLARALVGEYGRTHSGVVAQAHLVQLSRQGAVLVQVGIDAIANQRTAPLNLANLFAPEVWNPTTQRRCPTPLFIAVGPAPADPRTLAQINERCLLLKLRSAPAIGDFEPVLVEAWHSSIKTAIPGKLLTLVRHAAREDARTALEIIWLFATRQIDPRAQHPPRSVETIRRLPPRPEVLRHIVRSQCIEVMRVMWLAAYRDTPAQERAFNAACRAMGWFKTGEKVSLSLRGTTAGRLGIDTGDRDKITVPGVLLTDERLAQLEAYLLGGDDLPPFGGQGPGECPPSPGCPPGIPGDTESKDFCGVEGSLEGLSPRPLEAYYAREATTNDTDAPRARARDVQGKGDYLAGPAAITAVKAILAEPGPCALDFESYPTDPGWHGDAAAAAAPRGRKGAARDQARRTAELNGRAHLRRPCVLSLAHSNGAEVVVRLDDGADPAARRAELRAMFAGCRADPIAHRAQFEVELLLAHGVPLDIDCTWLMAKALLLIAFDPEKQAPPVVFGLAALVEREFGRVRDKTVRNRDWRLAESLDETAVEYCIADARDALELFQLYRGRLEAEGLLAGYRLIQQAILATAAVNLIGVEFDAEAHHALTAHLRRRAARLKRLLDQICDGAVRNHGSPQQVSNWIIEQVLAGDYADDPNRIGNFVARLCARTGVTWRQTKARHLAITKSVKARQAKALEPYYPVVARYLRAHALHTQVTKLADSFGEPLERWVDVDGRLRGQMTAGATVTLRQNAQHPPTQEMPRRKSFRRLFRAPAGRRLVDCDYSQIELRLTAIIASDEALLEVYRRGLDVHAEVAGNVALSRSQAKPVSFTMIYYGGAAKVAEAAGVSLEKGQEVLEAFLRAYPGIARFRERAPQEAQQAGFIAIRTDRRVRYDPAISKPAQAVNYPIQGGAASVQMLALRKVYDVLEAQPWLDARIVASVHDELILESPADERAEIAAGILQHEMRAALLAVFPEALAMGADRLAEAEVLASWAEKS